MRNLILAAVMLITPAIGFTTPATDASIHKLLQVTQIEKMTDSYYKQLKPMMEAAIAQSAPTPAERDKALGDLQRKYPELEKIMREELSFKYLEKDYIQLYRKNFSEEEVQGMLGFYSSPTGKAVIEKMPMVMQQSMMIVQSRMPKLLGRIQEVMRRK